MRYVFLIALLAATLGAEPTPAFVNALVQKTMASTGTPAVSLAIVRHGTIVYEKAYGYGNLKQKVAATTATTFPIGSVSKQFLAATMVAMAREGKLSLDDRLAKYEPSYTDASEITIAQLLAHEAGIRDYYPLDYPTLESYQPIAMQALADRYGHLPLDFAPGTRWQYSNSGYTIAGVIAQRLEGAALFDVYRRRFFIPLGMTSAHWIDGGFGPTDALGYQSYFFGPYEVAPVAAAAWLNAAGSLSMTAHDLALWTIALMEHNVVPATDTAILWQPRLLADGENPGYGLGFSIGAYNGHRMVTHGGEVVGYQSFEALFPDDNTSIIVFSDATPERVQLDDRKSNRRRDLRQCRRGRRPARCRSARAKLAARPRAGADRSIGNYGGLRCTYDARARRTGCGHARSARHAAGPHRARGAARRVGRQHAHGNVSNEDASGDPVSHTRRQDCGALLVPVIASPAFLAATCTR